MAKRSYSRKGNKIQPAVQTIAIRTPLIPNTGMNTSFYCDLSQIASIVNRRFYRQGINWAVAGFKIMSAGDFVGTVQVSKLPNTWVMSNAWEKGFRAWQKMNNEAIAEAGSLRPKFLDFKIYADQEHHQLGIGANLMPVAAEPSLASVYVPGEWDYSTYEIPVSNADPTLPAGNSTTRDVVAVGPNYVGPGASGNFAVSLIEGYASSRALPNIEDPNMPDDASSAAGSLAQNWQVALFNDGTAQDSEVIQDLETQNNKAPYPFENDGIHSDTMYPGGANQAPGLQLHDIEYITPTTIGGTTRLKGGNFPCGLIKFDFTNTGPETNLVFMTIDLVPGNHRGYLCEPMTEM